MGAFVGFNTLNGQAFRSRIFDVDPAVNGTFANTDPTKAPEGVAGFNVHTIAISIPLTELAPPGRAAEFNAALASGKPSNTTLFGVWASASRRLSRFSCAPGQLHYAQLKIPTVPDSLKYGRVDILQVINLDNIPSPGTHSVPIENGRTGDVLRVDVAVPPAFPNGRSLSGPAVANGKEEDVTDIELSLLLAGLSLPISDGVGGPGDGRRLRPTFPYLATPFAGDAQGKGAAAKF